MSNLTWTFLVWKNMSSKENGFSLLRHIKDLLVAFLPGNGNWPTLPYLHSSKQGNDGLCRKFKSSLKQCSVFPDPVKKEASESSPTPGFHRAGRLLPSSGRWKPETIMHNVSEFSLRSIIKNCFTVACAQQTITRLLDQMKNRLFI